MDVVARLEAVEAENQRLRDELDALKDSLGLRFLAPAELALTGKETAMFGRLLRGGLVTKDAFLAALYRQIGIEPPETKIIDVFICKLRAKLRPYGIEIATIWGVGYELTSENKARFEEHFGRRLAA